MSTRQLDIKRAQAVETRGASIREQMAAAAPRIARLKRIDRAAVGIITAGGIAVVLSVLGILLFIASEAVPLFRPSALREAMTVRFHEDDGRPFPVPQVIGSDEYQRYLYTITPDGRISVLDAASGARAFELPIPGLAQSRLTAASRSGTDDIAVGTDDGRVVLGHVGFLRRDARKQVPGEVNAAFRQRRVVRIDPNGRAIRAVSYVESEPAIVAAQVASDEVAFWWTGSEGIERLGGVRVAAGEHISHIRVGRHGVAIAGTDRGSVYRWNLDDDVTLTDVSNVGAPVSALEWVLGDNSFIAGTTSGELTGWFLAPLNEHGDQGMVRGHTFAPHSGTVTAIAASLRDRSFASVGAGGEMVLHHFTSNRVLLQLPGRGPVDALSFTPKGDGLIVVRNEGSVVRYNLTNPHPEISATTLLGKVWYEGYPAPVYVWQSTGATDDFESKFSLVPLLFGTLKGTLYAMLFATPLAVLGALYTSQFVHRRLRAKVKAIVEIMAALPSVVIGFLAGLYLAGVLEKNLVGFVLMLVFLPLFGTSGVLLWRLAPVLGRRVRIGHEILLIPLLLIVGGWLALYLGPAVEAWLFGSDARQWLQTTLGLTYDQRNSLVVGLAMGLAVIPIIFTISEDAFSSVPAELTAASLALGASPWQSAVRVVLPTASPGVFSAVMIGFGRAVGETMIVLMATGNTPIIDWSIVNGFRTLSANIAVEIPEAPYGGTLYRTLFLSGAMLFVLTFVVNTAAEVIRQRLRKSYRAA